MVQATSTGGRAIAGVRVATSILFLLFGEYKLAGPGFAHGGFQGYLQDFIASGAVSFYRPVLAAFILPHAVFFGYLVGVIESFVGLCLLFGLWVRLASMVGALFLVNLILATWWEPGHAAPLWRYFGAELDHLPLLLLMIIFYATDAGRVWGLDGRRK
jgi:uncharacterized membrane protein YphA (DoxX/SURF4 family)